MANSENDPEILALVKYIMEANPQKPETRKIIERIINSDLFDRTNTVRDIKLIFDAIE
jgi:hypothetical protein